MVVVGGTALTLFPIEGDAAKPPPGAADVAMRHFAFRTGRRGFQAARERLAARGIEFRFQDHTIAHSIYFPDPDGHKIEITTYDLPER